MIVTIKTMMLQSNWFSEIGRKVLRYNEVVEMNFNRKFCSLVGFCMQPNKLLLALFCAFYIMSIHKWYNPISILEWVG